MSVPSFQQWGSHEGARNVEEALVRFGHSLRHVTVVDPKPGRAHEVADRYAGRGSTVTVHVARISDVARSLDSDEPAILAIDDLQAMAEAARRRRRGPVLAQGVFQGAVDNAGFGAPLGGLTLPILNERPDEARLTAELLGTMADATPPQSSSALRSHPLDAYRLTVTRAKTSEGTVRDLLAVPRVIDRPNPASIFWAGERYPLVLARHAGAVGLRAGEHAEDVAGDAPLAVVLVTPGRRVDLFVVLRGRVRLHVPFVGVDDLDVTPRPNVPDLSLGQVVRTLASPVTNAVAAVGRALADESARMARQASRVQPRAVPAFTD